MTNENIYETMLTNIGYRAVNKENIKQSYEELGSLQSSKYYNLGFLLNVSDDLFRKIILYLNEHASSKFESNELEHERLLQIANIILCFEQVRANKISDSVLVSKLNSASHRVIGMIYDAILLGHHRYV